MANLGKLFVALLTSAGVDLEANADALKELTVLDHDVPDDIASALKSNLMTVESAKNDPTLKSYFTAQALNAVDTQLNDWTSKYEFDEDTKTALKGEQSSYKRMILALNKVKELEAKKAAGKGGKAGDETLNKLKTEIEKLNADVLTAKQSADAAKTEAQKEAESAIIQFAINAELASKNYANDALDKSVNMTVAKTIMEKALKDAGASIIRTEDGSLKLVQASEPSMDFMKENQKVQFGDFVDSTLANSKILKVSDGGNAGGAGSGNGAGGAGGAGGANTQNYIPPSNDKDAASSEAAKFMAEQAAAFQE